jgi:hypothetical protein
MKFIVAALALAVAATAQTIDDVPDCAIPCLEDAVASTTDCAADDYPCICSNFSTVQSAAIGCVLGACGLDVALSTSLPTLLVTHFPTLKLTLRQTRSFPPSLPSAMPREVSQSLPPLVLSHAADPAP